MSSKQLWQCVKKAKGIYPNNSTSFLNEKGRTITSTRNIANIIGRTLSDISKSDSYSEPFSPINETQNTHELTTDSTHR